jgi:hypothetical protein
MFSTTLMMAGLFYLVGVGLVLYIRPTLMFRPGGVWREFGISDSEHCTLFPFWMFALVWALLSYALATCFFLIMSSRSSPDGIEIYSDPSPPSPTAPANTPSILPVSSVAPAPSVAPTQPGYYILNPDTINTNGANYIYYGTEPPPPSDFSNYGRRRR